MRDFDYHRAESVAAALELAGAPETVFLAGGTNLVDHLKLGVRNPAHVVDITRLPLDGVEELDDGAVRVGALVRNSDLAAHPLIRTRFPVLSRALLAGASGQLRNMASTGGNLLQRTRCVYYQDVTTPCGKRTAGEPCSAIGGYTRYHAILGASEHCIAVHPSDMAVGMAVLDAEVLTTGPDGERRLPIDDFYRLPGDDPTRDTTLGDGELITAVELPPLPPDAVSTYRKVRDRASYAFALVSVAAVLHLDGDRIAEARVALGGVAHKPWRARRLEHALADQPATDDAFRAAAAAELAEAQPQPGNRFKIPMARNTIVSVLRELTEEARA